MSECSGADCPCQPADKVGVCEGQECGKTFYKEELTAYRFGHYNHPDGHKEPISLQLCPGCLIKKNGISGVTRDRMKVGRNEPCPCASGKKYKKCCA